MKKKILTKLLILVCSMAAFQGCKKYLDVKPNKNLSTPSTVADIQGLLDQTYFMNTNGSEIAEISADNYFLPNDIYNNVLPVQDSRDLYLWKQQNASTDWQAEYNIVYTANVALDNLPNIDRNSGNASQWDNCKGSALLFRANAFFEIAQIWAKAYNASTSKSDLGIPLRLTSDFNIPSKRASVEDTYNQIVNDLKSSISLLPYNPVNKFRPSKGAAYGLLARTYLSMRKYDLGKGYADSCLSISSKLIDYNTVDTTQTPPFSFGSLGYTNPEDIFHRATAESYYNIYYSIGNVDTLLLSLYDSNDLRKSMYFVDNGTGGKWYRGTYDAAGGDYNGLATDEVYLIRSECEARQGDLKNAQNDLNLLLKNRFKAGTFVPVAISNQSQLLQFILNERRKELCFRMLRWGDIKRLNLEAANISITRNINGQTHTLPANDPKFAVPIPVQVIQLSGIQQNP